MLSGAKKVIGLDINECLIEFAQENLEINYPNLIQIVEFKNVNLKDYDKNIEFNYIISKDSFEHIIDLDNMLYEMKRRLKKMGRIYVGFGPLYNSYAGDHHRTGAVFPWGHLIIPESILLGRINKKIKNKIGSIQELGLNKYSLRDYKRLFKESGLSILYFKINCSNHPISKLFTVIKKIPILEEYFSHNIYCILEKE